VFEAGYATVSSKLDFLGSFEHRSKTFVVAACLALIAVIGATDFLTGSEIFFSVFYLLAVGAGTWFVGTSFGVFLSILSAAAWIGGDVAAGARFSRPFVPIWNSAILLAFYFIVVWLVSALRRLRAVLEERVRERTVDLRREMAERERLEKEILEVSEREQRRIGRDLHDSLCQHFTGTALACRVLEEKLAAKSLPEADQMENIVNLVEDGIGMARSLARGISPVEMGPEGLVAAFQALATNVSKLANVHCVFETDTPISIPDAATATHLYRITQEAVTNAMRHGKAKRIDISLSSRNGEMTLSVEDDGVGLPDSWDAGPGLGTRIMAHRASMIGGKFSIEPNATGGTLVRCSLPISPQIEGQTDMPFQ
jgi:signal transduction histidine kinase